MPLAAVDLTAAANKIDKPFTIVPLAQVADLSFSLYICQGQVPWHRHLDEDELFLVHEGVVNLDTERGRLTLHSEELAVVPKGLGHRTGSQLRSVVVLIRPTILSDRKNGQRRYGQATDPPLEKIRLARIQAMLASPYQALTVGQVEDFELLLLSAQGQGPETTAPLHSALWLALRGSLTIVTLGGDQSPLAAGELLVVPGGMPYRLVSDKPSVVLTLARATP
jgi:mannose-6-phosphate isomerase-like protein (cupin superfamily)